MQAQVKYQSEVKTVPFGNRTIIIENLTPILTPTERAGFCRLRRDERAQYAMTKRDILVAEGQRSYNILVG